MVPVAPVPVAPWNFFRTSMQRHDHSKDSNTNDDDCSLNQPRCGDECNDERLEIHFEKTWSVYGQLQDPFD